MNGRRFIAIFLSVLILPIAVKAADPNPIDLLKNISQGLSEPYRGRVISMINDGQRSNRSEAEVFFDSPNVYRREYMSAEGSPIKVVICDGQTEWIHFIEKKLAWKGGAVKRQSKLLPIDKEWELFMRNYRVLLKKGEVVAGRDTWHVDIMPNAPGKPKRLLLVDSVEPVILRSEEINPDGSIAVESQFENIDFNSVIDDSLFHPNFPQGVTVKDHGVAPDFLTLSEIEKSIGKKLGVPKELPDGFEFESGNLFHFKGKPITHLRYTDGLNIISLFQSETPINTKNRVFGWHGYEGLNGKIGFSRAGHVYHWRFGNRHYTLVGNISLAAMRKLARSLK